MDSHNNGYLRGYKEGYQQGFKDSHTPPEINTELDALLNQPIVCLNLSHRAFNILDRYGHKHIWDVIALTEKDIPRMRNMGKISADEIARALRAAGVPSTDWYLFLL